MHDGIIYDNVIHDKACNLNGFHPCKSIRKQIWLCHKNGQGQPRVIIWTNFEVLEYPMLFTKFQGHRALGSGRKRFFKGFFIYGPGGHLGHVTRNIWTNFHSQHPWRLHKKFGFNSLVVFEEEKFENVEFEWSWQGQWITLTLGCYKSSSAHLFDYMYNFQLTGFNSFSEIYSLSISHTKEKAKEFKHAAK